MIRVILLLLVAGQVWSAPIDSSDNDMHPDLPPITEKFERANPREVSSSYWKEQAQKTVKEKIARRVNQNVAKNVILFLGDGMSVSTISAARVYLAGEQAVLSFETFPYTGLSRTYSVDRQVSDSANTATAYLGGVKTNYGSVGVGPEVISKNCLSMTNKTNHVLSIAYHSQLKNKRTGLVTTARVTHASPGGVYAHTSNRRWESDFDVSKDNEDPKICLDVASQLVTGETGKNLNVIMGGGRANFLPKDYVDEAGHNGQRRDGKNLIKTWKANRTDRHYVWNKKQLLALSGVDNVLGLFSHDHMDYNVNRSTELDPSLAEMTKAAIEILNRGENGYFLFVEGARIDMAHHGNLARASLDETVEFSKAVKTAVDLTNEKDTLIIVTADHAHTFSYSGYANRGNDIFGFAEIGADGIQYTTLSYATGPGYKPSVEIGVRYDVSKDDNFSSTFYNFPALALRKSAAHGGDDVPIYARGPWAHLFTGSLEQNVIPHLMSYASCVGDGITVCSSGSINDNQILINCFVLVIVIAYLM